MTSAADPLAEFRAENKQQGPKCSVRTLLADLDPERAERLRLALAERPEHIQHTAIARTVTKWGYRIGADTVKRHRNHECACV